MFCPHCGSQVADGVAFCSNCGGNLNVASQPVQQPVYDYQAQKMAVRQSEINALANVMQHFEQKRSEFEEYDAVCTLVNYYSRGAKGSLLVWGIIISVVGLLVCFADASAVVGGLVGFIIPGAAMIVGGILMKVKNRKNQEYYNAEYARLSEELYNHYLAYPNCPVGPEYVSPDILELIMAVMQSGRADTIKESINLLLAEADQDEINEYLASIEANTSAIRANTGVAAVFAAANFFKD